MGLLLNVLIGKRMVLMVTLLSKTRHYYIADLILLFLLLPLSLTVLWVLNVVLVLGV